MKTLSAICPAKTDNFVETKVDGERVIMQIENGFFFTLNASAEAVWTQIDGATNHVNIVKNVAQQFEVSTDVCETDIIDFLEELKENKLVIID